MNKQILLSLGMLAFVGAVVVGSTGAFFSDTESSVGNVFTAGSVTVAINGITHSYNGSTTANQPTFTPNGFSFSLTDLKPLDSGKVNYDLTNGANEAHICAMVTETSNADNSVNGPEAAAGDNTDGPGVGELGNFLNFKFGTTAGSLTAISGVYQEVGVVAANTNAPSGLEYCFGQFSGSACVAGTGNDNLAQTDSLTADVKFYAVQTRNNSNFTCASLNQTVTPGQKVGAVLGAYVAPTTSCTVDVTGTQSIQSAVNGLTSGGTVCVDTNYDRTGDNSAIKITNSGVTLAAKTLGVVLDVPVTVSASNVTVTGFKGVVGTAATAAEQAAFYLENAADNFVISYNEVTGGTGAAILTETGAAFTTGGMITNNVLSGATQGVYTNPHTGVITIQYNDFSDNAAGIAGATGATVKFNQFTGTTSNGEAIGVDSTYNSTNTTIDTNNFLNGWRINTYTSGMVTAENNFFNLTGTTQESGQSVDFTPEAVSQFAHN